MVVGNQTPHMKVSKTQSEGQIGGGTHFVFADATPPPRPPRTSYENNELLSR